MIYRDIYCEKCGDIKKDVVFDSINDDVNIKCEKCNTLMKNSCSCTSFTLRYDNKKDMCGWAIDNYNSSQYYRESK